VPLTAAMISRLAIPPVLTTRHLARTSTFVTVRSLAPPSRSRRLPFSQPELAVGGCRRFLAVMFSAASEGDRYGAKEEI
jgi:hypothetical protein